MSTVVIKHAADGVLEGAGVWHRAGRTTETQSDMLVAPDGGLYLAGAHLSGFGSAWDDLVAALTRVKQPGSTEVVRKFALGVPAWIA